jgi:hypothetical protein
MMAGGTHNRQQSDAARAKRDLKRLEEQSEKLVNPALDEDLIVDDPIEKWGRLIGRGFGYIVVVGLLYHLITTYLIK